MEFITNILSNTVGELLGGLILFVILRRIESK